MQLFCRHSFGGVREVLPSLKRPSARCHVSLSILLSLCHVSLSILFLVLRVVDIFDVLERHHDFSNDSHNSADKLECGICSSARPYCCPFRYQNSNMSTTFCVASSYVVEDNHKRDCADALYLWPFSNDMAFFIFVYVILCATKVFCFWLPSVWNKTELLEYTHFSSSESPESPTIITHRW
jgi:hypothetical protein